MTTLDSFPDYFPSCCPPENSILADGEVFRIIKNETLTDEDFLTHHELGLAVTADPCKRCSVSVFDSFQNASHLQKLRPKLGNAIAKGNLTQTAGKISDANKHGHIDWWSFKDIERKSFFGQPKLCT